MNKDELLLSTLGSMSKKQNKDVCQAMQEQGKEWKPKVGEWFKTTDGMLYLCEKSDGQGIVGNNQYSETSLFIATKFTKPTTEEIQAHLVDVAEKKYPVGTKFKNAVSNKEIGITDGDYEYSKENNALYTKDKPNKVSQCIWYNGKWAELAPIETEQRWNINILDSKAGSCGIYITRNPPLRKLKAQELQEAIKQYLSTNKF